MNKEEQAKEFIKKGEEAYNNEEYEKAKKFYEKAIELDENNVEAYNDLAFVLTKQFEEHKKAREYYEKAIKLNPNIASPYNNLAALLEQNFEKYEKAKEYYEKAIEINPYFAPAYNNLAVLLEKHFQEYEKAKKYYEKAIGLNQNNKKFYNNLFVFLKKYLPKAVKKISQITLKDYNQFEKDIVIDLTYPAGHEKAGKPLEKICFIGQSGTGKTSLLELIKHHFFNNIKKIPNATEDKIFIKFRTYEKETDISLINIPPYAVENIKNIDEDEILDYEYKEPNHIIDFAEDNPTEHWYPILNEIIKYQKNVVETFESFNKKVTKVRPDRLRKELDVLEEEIKKFKEDEKNPLKKLDEFLEPLLSKFNLQINRTASKPEDLLFIPVENIWYNEENDREIEKFDIEFQSTGTKQILSRLVPMFALKPKHTAIIIDEPENSLYPDMQKAFVEFLTNESWNEEKTCQFFFATHSPTIASSFEPWEIIALEFNETGKVTQKRFYEGERHIDNFITHPKYLRWDDILMDMFDVKEKGDKERNEKLQELARLKRDVLSSNYTEEEKEKIVEKYIKLSKLLRTND